MFNKQKIIDNIVNLLTPMKQSYMSDILVDTHLKYSYLNNCRESYADIWLIPSPFIINYDNECNRFPVLACLVLDKRMYDGALRTIKRDLSKIGVKEFILVDLCSENINLYKKECNKLALYQRCFLRSSEDMLLLNYNNIMYMKDITLNAR